VSAALIEWAERMKGLPFEWGQTDCATLTMRGLELLTGRDFPDYRWATEAGAWKVAERELPSSVLTAYGLVEVDPGFQRCGDVILVPRDSWPECCHLCLGRYSLSGDPHWGVILVRTGALLAMPGAAVMGLR
jgi:hypothetical protein